ncbi:MAG: hypothetical protein ABJF88_16250 [Rhodothermales bacterium]
MQRRRAHPADHVHFSSGFAGWVRWVVYWIASRSVNGAHVLARYGRTRVLPFLDEQRTLLVSRIDAEFGRVRDTTAAPTYSSLAEAVRRRRFTNARG